jgi:hypothetical protein
MLPRNATRFGHGKAGELAGLFGSAANVRTHVFTAHQAERNLESMCYVILTYYENNSERRMASSSRGARRASHYRQLEAQVSRNISEIQAMVKRLLALPMQLGRRARSSFRHIGTTFTLSG